MSPQPREPAHRMAAGACCVAVALLLAGCTGEAPRPRRPDPDRPNPASIGVIDIPAPGTVVGPILRLSGWVADESGVAWVRLYVGNRILEHIPLSIPRPDVEKEFPQFTTPGALHGWHTTVDFGDDVGYTHISAEALDGRGGLTRFASISVKIRP